MREHRPSFTAAFVASCRGLGVLLPARARIVEDRFGARFGGRIVGAIARAAERVPGVGLAAQVPLFPLVPWITYMQVRTRALDDEVRRFADEGGRQLVILGAGFDCRAARLAGALAGASVFEIDHPATQARKRAILDEAGADSPARYVAWDFERDPLAELPARLASLGLDPRAPTLTLWEGVTMYLSEEAIAGVVAAVGAFSAPGSRLAFNYVHRDMLRRPGLVGGLVSTVVRRVGEPWRWGWEPAELPGWLDARGFRLERDASFDELAERLLPGVYARLASGVGRRLAVAERTAVAGVK